ncbi:Peptide methionine sulfoxide reductase MsrA/MsrB [uncultured Eubacterium sp.]|nr:Peptide methionine sulfoxide reductase MsrA/MsrB [uncultured Eubacterium sp.]
MIKTIYLAGGCFWGLQKLMKEIKGVVHSTAGYANGTGQADANYQKVCSGKTGFREAVRVDYDPAEVDLAALLHMFFYVIDPEAVNQQGNDVGSQYQSGIYYDAADEEAEETVLQLSAIERERYQHFAVEIKPIENFFDAEDYHQDYLDKNQGGYCHISPKKMKEARAMLVNPGNYRRPDNPKEIKERLSKEQYYVTQESGTEPPFKNVYWDHFEKGIYVDVVTGEPLFSSYDKFNSSCGWPAFSRPIEDLSMVEKRDRSFGMIRTEVRSRAGNSHLGHVFEGERESPNSIRYCINSAALRFIPFEKMEEEGYGYLKGIFK